MVVDLERESSYLVNCRVKEGGEAEARNMVPP